MNTKKKKKSFHHNNAGVTSLLLDGRAGHGKLKYLNRVVLPSDAHTWRDDDKCKLMKIFIALRNFILFCCCRRCACRIRHGSLVICIERCSEKSNDRKLVERGQKQTLNKSN